MIIEVGRILRSAILVSGKQSAVNEQFRCDEIRGGGGGVNEIIALQDSSGDGEAPYGQGIPRSQLFFIALRCDARTSMIEKDLAGACNRGFDLSR